MAIILFNEPKLFPQLVQALKFGDKVQPIPISEAEVPVGEKLQMVGWMISNHQGNKTSNLKEVAVETISSEDCQSFYDKTLSNAEFCTLPVPENNLCEVSDYIKEISRENIAPNINSDKLNLAALKLHT